MENIRPRAVIGSVPKMLIVDDGSYRTGGLLAKLLASVGMQTVTERTPTKPHVATAHERHQGSKERERRLAKLNKR